MTTLFIADSDERALNSVRKDLLTIRPQWSVVGLASGLDVLKSINTEKTDCILTEVKLQDMSGFDLLSKLRANYPDIVRITLSANLDQEVVMESARANHRFINRALPTSALVNAIESSLLLRDVLSDNTLKRSMNEIVNLPSLPEIYQKMVDELTSPQSSLLNVGKIIETDAALVATVLKIVNSAFYGLNQRVESVSQGVALLGVHLIKNITLTAKVFAQFEGSTNELARLRQLNDNANKTGALTNQMARLARVSRTVVDHAQIAGMLSNIGHLILMSRSSSNSINTTEVSSELQGAYLLRLWRLPDPVIEAIALQHVSNAETHVEITPHTILHAIRYLEEHLVNINDKNEREACQNYLEAMVPAMTAELWIDAYCDLQALTSHTDATQSRVA